MIYVLTTKMKGEWRPVAVVDEMHLDDANQWYNVDPKANDFIPLELNDLTGTEESNLPGGGTFKPAPMPAPPQMIKDLKAANDRLVGIIKMLAERHNDKDVLKVLKQMGKIGKTPTFELWDLQPRVHAPSCPYRKQALLFESGQQDWQDASCNCLTDRLLGGRVGCLDCDKDANDGHSRLCPRMKQQALFAGKQGAEGRDWGEETLLAEGFEGDELQDEKDRRWRLSHAPSCIVRDGSGSMTCSCKHDKIKPDASGCSIGCGDCGVHWDELHKPDCPRMTQGSLFQSELLKGR